MYKNLFVLYYVAPVVKSMKKSVFLQGLVALQFLQVFVRRRRLVGGQGLLALRRPHPHTVFCPPFPCCPTRPAGPSRLHTTVAIFWLKNAISGWSQHQHQQQLYNTGKNLLQKTKKHLYKFGAWIILVKKLTVSFSVNVCHIVIDCGKSFFFYYFCCKKNICLRNMYGLFGTYVVHTCRLQYTWNSLAIMNQEVPFYCKIITLYLCCLN